MDCFTVYVPDRRGRGMSGPYAEVHGWRTHRQVLCGTLQPLPDTGEIEIGWWLALAWWGRGLATEAATTALGDAFDRVGFGRLIAVAERGNRASVRIMRKLGLTFEREFEAEGSELVRYGIDRAEWAAAALS